jgi:uncharacterized protein (DUF1697 family)
MISYVALLRGINVGGRSMVAMSDLCKLLESLDFVEVQSLLQSGNLVFKSGPLTSIAIENILEKEAAQSLGRPIDFLVRNSKEWKAIITNNPFHEEAVRDPSHLLVMCLKDAPNGKALTSLKAAIAGQEYFQAQGRQLYIVYPDGIGRSKLTISLIEKKLDTRGTGRNWNTIQKISAALSMPSFIP